MQSMAEAKAWLQRLSKHSITTRELDEFRNWRDDPLNDAAYTAAEKEWDRSRGRFVMVETSNGYDVTDRLTGDHAQFANAKMCGLSEEDADDIVDLLNRRAKQTRNVAKRVATRPS